MVSSSTLISKKQIELINATNKLSPEQLDNLLIFLNSLNAMKKQPLRTVFSRSLVMKMLIYIKENWHF